MIHRLGDNPKLLVMNQHFLKTVFLFFLLSQISLSFSQNIRGKYITVNTPADATSRPLSADGVFEFPVKITKANIKLKAFHRFELIQTNLDNSNPQVSEGNWEISGKRITLNFKRTDFPVFTMELVELKSGIYLKSVNDYFYYYKKQ